MRNSVSKRTRLLVACMLRQRARPFNADKSRQVDEEAARRSGVAVLEPAAPENSRLELGGDDVDVMMKKNNSDSGK